MNKPFKACRWEDIPTLVVGNCEECGIPVITRRDVIPVFCDPCCMRSEHNPEFDEKPGPCFQCGEWHLNYLICDPEGRFREKNETSRLLEGKEDGTK